MESQSRSLKLGIIAIGIVVIVLAVDRVINTKPAGPLKPLLPLVPRVFQGLPEQEACEMPIAAEPPRLMKDARGATININHREGWE